MKKLLSLSLALIMVLSTVACLPFGAFAVGTESTPAQQTLYAEDFETLEDGKYTAERLAYLLGWEILRGDATQEIATVTDGVLTLDTKASTVDYLFAMAKSARFLDSHTVQYDLTMVENESSVKGGDGRFFFAAVYTGSYGDVTKDVSDGARGTVPKTDKGTTAIIPKVTYEGYHHLAYAKDSWINEVNHSSSEFLITGAGYEQGRPESIPYEGGYGKVKTKATWKTVINVDQNQVDVYANGGRVNSTETSKVYDRYHVSDFLGDTAFLRVQLGRVAEFDNISIVTGGNVIVPNGNVVYEQNFDDITYDPETETPADLAAKIGWVNLQVAEGIDPTEVDENEASVQVSTSYKIVDGMLDILNPYKAAAVAPQIFIPEMEKAKDQIVIEYDQMYVYKEPQGLDENGVQLPDKDVLGEYDGGDQPITFTMYGRRSDFYVKWEYTQKGFNKFTFKNGANHMLNKGSFQQIRPQNVGYSHCVSGYAYSDQGGSHYNIYRSLDHVKVVLDKTDGVEIYMNGNLTWFLDAAQTALFLDTSNSNGPEHMLGGLLKMNIPGGCHVRLDNMKVTVDPEDVPELLITEVATTVNDKDEFEYVEVYNNASERINIYEYCLVTDTIVNSFKSDITQQKEIDAAIKKGNPVYQPSVLLMYPGSHTYKSVPDKKTGISPYSVTLENPAYEDGWLEPGEVAMIWNTANAMHSEKYTSPTANDEEWSYTVEDFRTEVNLGEDVKVFQSYNDYNTTLENTGRYMVGIGTRSAYQPGYQPMYQRGDETVVPNIATYRNTVSYVYMLIDGAFDPYINKLVAADMKVNEENTVAYPLTSGYCYRNNYSDLLDPKTGGPCTLLSAQFVYGFGNASAEGRCLDQENVETMHDVTPGTVLDVQKRAFTFRVDEYDAETKYLGELVEFDNYMEDGFKPLFMKVNNDLFFENYSLVVTENVAIERVGMNLVTEDGVLTYDGTNAWITWTTKFDQSRFDTLLHYKDLEVVKSVEVGVLIAQTAQLSDTVTLTLEHAGNGVVFKSVEKTENWFDGLAAEEGAYDLSVVMQVPTEQYGAEVSAVGYISVTLLDETVITIYGTGAEGAPSDSVISIATALRDGGYEGVDNATKAWIETILPPVVTE